MRATEFIKDDTINRNPASKKWQVRADSDLELEYETPETILKDASVIVTPGKKIFAYIQGSPVTTFDPTDFESFPIRYRRDPTHPFYRADTEEPIEHCDYVAFNSDGSVIGYMANEIMSEDTLTEGATSVLYHYTGTPNALRILQSGVFELSSTVGNKSEEQYAPKGYPYFFSTTRSKVGDYHRYVGTGGVMFVLDGDWFSQRYPVKPIDYWERMWQHSPDRTRESEDRVFAKEATIPINGVRAVHVLLKEQNETRSPQTRQILILAKKAGIPTYLYTDEKAWRLQDTRKALDIKQAAPVLKGQEPSRITRPSRDSLEDWLELIYKKNKGELSERAEKLRYTLVYYGSRYPTEDQNLSVDMSNARKPGTIGHETAIKLIDYMRKNGIKSTVDLKNALVAKWDKLS